MKRYSKEIQDFIAANVKGRANEELANLTNKKFGTDFTASKMSSYKCNHNLKSGITYNGSDKKEKLFPDEIIEFMKTNAKGLYNNELKELVNKTFGTNYSILQIENVKHRHHISSGITGYFEKGHIPQNKGKKMSAEVYEKCAGTMFKKGNIPQNYRPVGSERISKDGYLQIKVAEPDKWQQKNVYIYEQYHNVKVPKGHKVIFLDGDIRNFDVNNLALVSNNEMCRLNQNHRVSKCADITKTNITLTKLEITIRDKMKKGK